MASDRLNIVYATDEDVWVICSSDFGVIAPRSSRVAKGSDGSIAAGGWVLTSLSSNFVSQGVTAGMVVRLDAPASAFNPPQYLAIESVTATTMTLRRCGLPTGTGMAPGPTGGAASVAFEVVTLNPQIEDAAYALHQRFGVDPKTPNYTPTDIYDDRVFRRLTIFYVLKDRYTDLSRTAEPSSDFWAKAKHYSQRFDEEMAIAVVRWGSNGDLNPPTTRFNTRISR